MFLAERFYMFKSKNKYFIGKKVLFYIFLFSITQRFSFATTLLPSPACRISWFIDYLLIYLLIIFSISLLIKIIRYLLVKSAELKTKLKKRGISTLKILSVIAAVYLIKGFIYCPLMNYILGKENDFFKITVGSCNSWMPCPKETPYQCCNRMETFLFYKD